MRLQFGLLYVMILLTATGAWSQPESTAFNDDSTRVVQFKNTADSLMSLGLKDSAEHYLLRALAICEKEPATSWKISEMMRVANRLVRVGKIDLSEQYINTAIERAVAVDLSTTASAYERAGGYYSERGQFAKAYDLLEKAADIFQQMGDDASYADCLVRMGGVFDGQGLHDKSLSYYMRAYDIYEQIQDSLGQGYLLNDVAISFAKQKDYRSAIEYYKKGLVIYRALGDSLLTSNTYGNLGITYKNVGEYEKAYNYLSRSLEYYNESGDPYSLASIYHNFGELYAVQKMYEKAIEYYEMSQRYAVEADAAMIIANNHLVMARACFALRDFNKSMSHCESGLTLAERLNLMDLQRELLKVKADNLRVRGDYKRSLETFLEYSRLNDSLQNEERTQRINQLHTQFEVFQKDGEIQNLRSDALIQEEKNKVQARLNKLLIIGAGGLILLLALLALMYVRTKRLNMVLAEQKKLLQDQHEEIKAGQDKLLANNEKLMQLNDEKDDIIAIVAHDLRSPLNQIHGLLSLVNSKNLSGDEAQYLKMVSEVADTMKLRINKMLDVAAMNAGELNLQMQKMRASDIIAPVARTFAEQARRKGIDLIVELNGDDNFVHADRNYLLQVYENLVSNALKFSAPDKKVWLQLANGEGSVKLKVRDEGPGISDEEQELLFNKYQSLSARPTRGEDSTGLGLAIVKKYVEAMGGKVWCESKVGEGSEFIVEFPQA